MEYRDITLLLSLLLEARIPVCIIGELALNYYNAPRVVHDLELCVLAVNHQAAAATFDSETTLLERAHEANFDIYTEYKKGCPRFKLCCQPICCVTLFTDAYCHLDPLRENVISRKEHQVASEYSNEILDTFTASQVVALPLSRFTPFFVGLCERYVKTGEATAGMAAEQLVDGMNLDDMWCKSCGALPDSAALRFALRLIAGKRSRIADFSENEVTCFVPTQAEADRISRIPGFKTSSFNQRVSQST